ncbi:MAG: cyclase family protein [Nitrososphaerota archaeon]|nr:cyclase family protein [Nitrososphaerota archaeon]
MYGALRSLSEANVAQAALLVKRGRVYQLGRVLDVNSPAHPFHGPLFYSTFRRVKDSLRVWRGSFGAMNVRLEMSDHTGTHIDALNHVSIGNMLYGGRAVEDIEWEMGTRELGAENFQPIVTRGLLLDIAASKGLGVLEDNYLISVEDVVLALKFEGVAEPREGDAVLFRTGWGALWGRDNSRYIGPPIPGISIDVAKWLSARNVVLVGGDTPSVERISVEPPNTPHVEPVHQHLIVEKGIFMLENLDLEELSSEKVYEFLFICNPVRIRGATAGHVNPIAIT